MNSTTAYWLVIILFSVAFTVARRVMNVDFGPATVLYTLGVVAAAITISINSPTRK